MSHHSTDNIFYGSDSRDNSDKGAVTRMNTCGMSVSNIDKALSDAVVTLVTDITCLGGLSLPSLLSIFRIVTLKPAETKACHYCHYRHYRFLHISAIGGEA